MQDQSWWVDTHAHVTHSKVASGLEQTIANCRAENVRWIVSAATCASDATRLAEIVAESDTVRAAVGIHPNDTHLAANGDWETIVRLASEAKNVVAIGETGLDRYWKDSPFDIQTDYFLRHLELAETLNLPVVIHCRDAMTDILKLLEDRGRPVRGTLHCFTGSIEDAQRLMQIGLHLGFGGICTFTNKEFDALRDVIRQIPEERILTETDAPFLSPHPFRGKPNEPARVAVVGRAIAAMRGWTDDYCARVTTDNACKLFVLKD
ncbi:MAG: TatD family hydrolase [Isosphaeraceae bacterium]